MASEDKINEARKIFLDNGGVLRTRDAIGEGIHPRTLYAMRDAGIVETMSRGLYRLSNLPPLGNPDIVAVALKVTKGVICLISALAYYEITTQIPHYIYVALPRGAEQPRMINPPVRPYWFSGRSFSEGITKEEIDGIPVRIYSPEKTLADCFKYRNKIGLEVALEALDLYRREKIVKVDEILRFARINRVENVMRPYLEAIL
ncbi:MAG: transcriptional regulator [Chloroflexi bacterium RBG_16_48_8]|nr:MAG: transcriptional regulator [Chloroflexi bacterium RBG_16_48_8]